MKRVNREHSLVGDSVLISPNPLVSPIKGSRGYRGFKGIKRDIRDFGVLSID